MKVTTDPAGRQNPIREGAGPVTSDSLAAESVRAGGGFSENRDSQPLAVKGANSTFNTTDTSAADELPPSRDAASRPERGESLAESGKNDTARTQKGDTRSGGTQDHHHSNQQARSHQQEHGAAARQTSSDTAGTVGSGGHPQHQGASGGQQSTGSQGTKGSSGSSGGGHKGEADTKSNQPGVAPTYVKADVLDQPHHPKPKGANLTEGGFDSDDAHNASFNTEIGSKDDPGRLAELKFERARAVSARDAGHGPRQKEVTNDGQYDVLSSEEQA